MIEYPVKITFSTDKSSLKKAEKEADKVGSNKSVAGTTKGAAAGGFAGGLLGGLLGNILGSLDSISGLLKVVGALLNSLIAPFIPILVGLFRPFLSLFLLVGGLLFKWLTRLLGGGTGKTGEGAVVTNKETGQQEVGTSLLSSIALLAGGIALITAVIMGAPVWLTAAVTLLAAFIATQLGEYILNAVLTFAAWLDKILNTDFVGSITMIFQGFTDVVMGLVDMLWSLVTLDWEGIKEGFVRMVTGMVESVVGVFMFAWNLLKGILVGIWELLKTIFVESFNVLKTIGQWIWDTLVSVFTTAFNILSGIGSWIKDKVMGFFSFGGSSKSVNDAIITGNGQVIQTNPKDYLIATKDPSSLGGGSTTINITIQGNADRNVIEELARKLQQQMRLKGAF